MKKNLRVLCVVVMGSLVAVPDARAAFPRAAVAASWQFVQKCSREALLLAGELAVVPVITALGLPVAGLALAGLFGGYIATAYTIMWSELALKKVAKVLGLVCKGFSKEALIKCREDAHALEKELACKINTLSKYISARSDIQLVASQELMQQLNRIVSQAEVSRETTDSFAIVHYHTLIRELKDLLADALNDAGLQPSIIAKLSNPSGELIKSLDLTVSSYLSITDIDSKIYYIDSLLRMGQSCELGSGISSHWSGIKAELLKVQQNLEKSLVIEDALAKDAEKESQEALAIAKSCK